MQQQTTDFTTLQQELFFMQEDFKTNRNAFNLEAGKTRLQEIRESIAPSNNISKREKKTLRFFVRMVESQIFQDNHTYDTLCFDALLDLTENLSDEFSSIPNGFMMLNATYYNLGQMYELGEGVEKNDEKSIECYKKASQVTKLTKEKEKGHPKAQLLYAAYLEKQGDFKKSFELFTRSTNPCEFFKQEFYPRSYYYLATMFLNGRAGLTPTGERNIEQAKRYALKAKESGLEEANIGLGKIADEEGDAELANHYFLEYALSLNKKDSTKAFFEKAACFQISLPYFVERQLIKRDAKFLKEYLRKTKNFIEIATETFTNDDEELTLALNNMRYFEKIIEVMASGNISPANEQLILSQIELLNEQKKETNYLNNTLQAELEIISHYISRLPLLQCRNKNLAQIKTIIDLMEALQLINEKLATNSNCFPTTDLINLLKNIVRTGAHPEEELVKNTLQNLTKHIGLSYNRYSLYNRILLFYYYSRLGFSQATFDTWVKPLLLSIQKFDNDALKNLTINNFCLLLYSVHLAEYSFESKRQQESMENSKKITNYNGELIKKIEERFLNHYKIIFTEKLPKPESMKEGLIYLTPDKTYKNCIINYKTNNGKTVTKVVKDINLQTNMLKTDPSPAKKIEIIKHSEVLSLADSEWQHCLKLHDISQLRLIHPVCNAGKKETARLERILSILPATQLQVTESLLEKTVFKEIKKIIPKASSGAVINGLPVDILVAEHALIIQVNGPTHYLADQHELKLSPKDRLHDAILEKAGYQVIHIGYHELPKDKSAWQDFLREKLSDYIQNEEENQTSGIACGAPGRL